MKLRIFSNILLGVRAYYITVKAKLNLILLFQYLPSDSKTKVFIALWTHNVINIRSANFYVEGNFDVSELTVSYF